MHPAVTADQPGAVMPSLRRHGPQPPRGLVSPSGQVLAVPRSAVVDAGARKVVWVENMPGMFDGVEVVLGPRCGDFYPVVRGLDAAQRVAIAGAFLLDAETRLNPGLAAAYFGANRGERTAAPATSHEPARAAPGSATTALAAPASSPRRTGPRPNDKSSAP